MPARIQLMALVAAVLTVAGAGCKKGSGNSATQDVGAASTRTSEVAVSTVQLGRSLGSDKRVANATTNFSPRDTIYASVETSGSAPSSTITARWTYEGQQVVKEDSRTISPNGTEVTEFHISKPSAWPKGKYQFTATVGGSTQSKDFEVK